MATKKPGSPTSANTVLGLDHLVLRVRDLATSIAFYKAVLGAKVERQLQTPRIVQLRIGESLLDLVPGRAARNTPPNLDHFAVRVANFDAAALTRLLSRHGIEPGEVRERYGSEGYGPSIYFPDPDGNVVEVKGPAVRPRIRR
jgi:glyoxylase I family protein